MVIVYFVVLATDHEDLTLRDQIAYRLSGDNAVLLAQQMLAENLCALPRNQVARHNFNDIVATPSPATCNGATVAAYIYAATRRQ